jgi:hypothetical protein
MSRLRLLRTPAAAALAVFALSLAPPGAAEDLDPDALFESAKAAYGERKYGKALADLRLLVSEVGRRRVDALREFLPGTTAGFTAGEVEATDLSGLGMAVGATLRRDYDKAGARASVELTVDSPMVGALAMAMNPMIVQASGHTIVRVKGRQALLEVPKGGGDASITMLLASNTASLKVSGPTKADAEALAGAMDLDRLEKALQE